MSQNNSNNDYVELTCPDFDPAIDEHLEAASHANTSQESTDNTGGFNYQDSTGLEHQPRSISPGTPETPADLPPLEEHTPEEESDYNWSPEYDNWHETTSRSLEDIPELLDDSEQEEDWENGQFLDSEPDHTSNNILRRDYSEAFL